MNSEADNSNGKQENMDQVWIEILLSPESDIRILAENGYMAITAYSYDFSSEVVIKEEMVY